MIRKYILSAGIASVCFISSSSAYETHTHAYMGDQIFTASNLGNGNAPELMKRLGLDRLSDSLPFGDYWNSTTLAGYYDNVPGDVSADIAVSLRFVNDFERRQLQLLLANSKIPATAVEKDSAGLAAKSKILPIRNWLMRGMIREDDLVASQYHLENGDPPDMDPRGEFIRVYNHFYDPIYNQRLTWLGAPCSGFFWSGGDCSKSVDWFLGTADAFASQAPDFSRRNHFSWADARENYWWALTGERDADNDGLRSATERKEESRERLRRWATTFDALGHVGHGLTDMGQPQHTRNDTHDVLTKYANPEAQAFESFTNARLITADEVGGKTPSAGDIYVKTLNGAPLQNMYITQLPAGTNGYPIPTFGTPLRFFTTRNAGDGPGVNPSGRFGLADYTNRGFFTSGTLPDSSEYTYPPVGVANGVNGYTRIEKPCAEFPSLGGRVTSCAVYTHTVPDALQPGRADVTTPQPMVAESLWNSPNFPQVRTALGPEIFQTQANLAVPRAIAYGAGILNYFFRGELTVSAPRGGLFSVIDHGIAHYVDGDGYPRKLSDGISIFGFTQLRVRVANTTSAIMESGTNTNIPQTAKSGKLVAVAKYHRNPCYKPDLSGEYVKKIDGTQLIPAGCSTGQVEALRTPYQEISVSAPVNIDANGNVSGGGFGNSCDNVGNLTTGGCGKDSVLSAFDFSADPIPVNATDLFVQVVYRGELGQEKDGIAVGTMDLMEPTYAMTWNNSDWWWHQDAWHAASEFSGTYPFHAMNMCFNDQFIFYTNDGALSGPVTGPVNAGQFVRVALLTDEQPHAYGQIVQWDITPTEPVAYGMTVGAVRQASKERVDPAEGINQQFVVQPIGGEYGGYGRGITFGTHWGFIYVDNYTSSGYTTPEAMLALQPALSGPNGVGRPVAGGVNFSSEAEAPCSQFMPPSVPGALPPHPATLSNGGGAVGVQTLGH